MNKGFKLIIVLIAVLLCLTVMLSCKNNAADTESSESSQITLAESTDKKLTTDTESQDTTDTEAQTSDETSAETSREASTETEKGGIRPGQDSDHRWGEFEPA